MLRRLFSVFLLIACLATLNCQSYTTGLTQGSSRADEGTALATMRAIVRAQTAYNISNSGDYGTFEQLVTGGYLDERFNNSKPRFYGYLFTMNATPKSGSTEGSYGLNADPDPALKASGRHFYVDSTSPEIHVNPSQQASVSDAKMEP